MSHASSISRPDSLPLVIQVGFAGARKLFDAETHPGVDTGAFQEGVKAELARLMLDLPKELGVAGQPFFLCGISQVAVGGDTLFSHACQRAGIAQRVFLPQPRDEYLNAIGSKGPDFSADQRGVALGLLASPHVIQVRVVSDAECRKDRFRDVNLELARVSDVLVCLVGATQTGQPGGTHELIELAKKRQRPVVELRVDVGPEGKPSVSRQWHYRECFRVPRLPASMGAVAFPGASPGGLPDITDYVKVLKDLSSQQANWQRKLFKWAALVIIGAHVLATLIAVLALTQHAGAIPWLLGGELLLLATGLGVHQYLHRTHALQRWAVFRLVAEVARSVTAIGRFHVYLEHLFTLPFPAPLRPLLRTISVLHLRSTAGSAGTSWEAKRDAYVEQRLTSVPAKAQIPYNQTTRAGAQARLKWARRVFASASALAFIATLVKLLTLCHCLPVSDQACLGLASWMGALAVVLPVIAVAALSLAVAFDLEAKLHTSSELLEFLDPQKTLLQNASSAREYSRLLLETESRLLGETVNWHARRSVVGVT